MKYNKTKNGLKITVKEWDNKIIITNISTGKIVATEIFSDHVQAVMLAKKL